MTSSNKLEFFSNMPFQSSLMGLGLEPTIEWNTCKVRGLCLAYAHYTKLEMSTRAKHSNVYQKFINYVFKKFYHN